MTKTIFIVDDDVAILELLRIVLEEEGFTVVADTGGDMISIATNSQPDAILLDIWMRGIDGRELSRQVKSDPKLASIPVILMSAHSHAGSIVDEAMADDFIEKPFDIDTMLKVVRRYV